MYGKMKKMKDGGKKPSAKTKKNIKAAGMLPGVGTGVKKKKMIGRNAMLQVGRKGGKKMYREGGSSDINASYKDFLDL